MVSRKAHGRKPDGTRFPVLAREIAAIAQGFYARGWALGTSGNFSAVVQANPLRLAITASGMDKGRLEPSQIVEIDEQENIVAGKYRPSVEAALHVAIVRKRPAGAVFHTHSTWGTILSETHAHQGGAMIKGYEMLKGLANVHSHEHAEWLPILENSQDMKDLSGRITKMLDDQPSLHGFLLRRHGLYTWGSTLSKAKRHVEILEFLMEVFFRSGPAPSAGQDIIGI